MCLLETYSNNVIILLKEIAANSYVSNSLHNGC